MPLPSTSEVCSRLSKKWRRDSKTQKKKIDKVDKQSRHSSHTVFRGTDLSSKNYQNDLSSTIHREINHFRESERAAEEQNFPQDSYSFLVLNGPNNVSSWPRQKFIFFLFGLFPFIFQMVLLILLLWSTVDEKRGTVAETDNPDPEKYSSYLFWATFIPANASTIVKATQVVSMAAYLAYPEASLQDLITAVRFFPRTSKVKRGDPIGNMRFACVLRGIQGTVATFATLILILTTDTVVDIILNFTAVNFISRLDNQSFELAMEGEFGPALKAEAERITDTPLPHCMYRDKSSKKLYRSRLVMAFLSLALSVAMIYVMVSQQRTDMWITEILRVQFQDDALNEFSGCFNINTDLAWYQRYVYDSADKGSRNTSFGYCRDERQWILFKGSEDDLDPCEAKKEERELARSPRTNTFDVSALFDESWVSSSNSPLNLYFFDVGVSTENLTCDRTLGDGICDQSFNEFSYQFDGGDCCVATCTSYTCGRGGITSAFGDENSSGNGFPNCIDPEMEPITIRLNDLSSSRDPDFTKMPDNYFSRYSIDETEWRAKTPVYPYFALECNGKSVLSVYIRQIMLGNNMTVMVEDSADCSLVVRNTTSNKTPNPAADDPIWFINYTLFDSVGNEEVEIVTQSSSETEAVNFRKIPNCYFRKLQEHLDVASVYTVTSTSSKSIDWLLEDDSEISQCQDNTFIERYALVNMILAMNGTSQLLRREKHCSWPTTICSEGSVKAIKLQDAGLGEEIPSEIGLLQRLEELELSGNGFSSIPTGKLLTSTLLKLDLNKNEISSLSAEIGNLTTLHVLSLFSNRISSISTEIGLLASLKELVLSGNKISYLPTEFGSMASLNELNLDYNQILYLPTEIGMLSSLQKASLVSNRLTSIPTEIGTMISLQKLNFDLNQISFLPTEIGLLKSLEKLSLYWNGISSLPTEFGLMTSLQELSLQNNTLSSIPSEIGTLTRLQTLDLYWNNIVSLPTDIGLMTSLQQLGLEDNFISSLPTEIGMLTSLKEFYLQNNGISSLPTEIGRLTNMQKLDLYNNNILSLPIEIGRLTNMQKLDLYLNDVVSLPIEIGNMIELQKLDLGVNWISYLPTEIGLLTSLVDLVLEYNQISNLPTEIGMLTSLETLDLYNNKISSVPTEIGLLRNVQRLDLGYNVILSLPTEFWFMTSLQSFSLANNQVSSLPTEIGLLTSLERLEVYRNKVSSIPLQIGLMTSLEEFRLENNLISSLPREFGFMTSLQTLSLTVNKISVIPTEFGLMTSLQELGLGNNYISSIPIEIGKMISLESLYLFNNQISAVPSNIGLLSSLKSLYMHNNSIASIPSQIERLTNLENLWLNDNQLTSLPTEIGLLTSLKALQLHNNNFVSIPSEIGLLTGLTRFTLSTDGNKTDEVPEEIEELCLSLGVICEI